MIRDLTFGNHTAVITGNDIVRQGSGRWVASEETKG